jgi:Ca2+-binding EF-hand superfamily protein
MQQSRVAAGWLTLYISVSLSFPFCLQKMTSTTAKRIQDAFNAFDIEGRGELCNSDVALLLQGLGFEGITKEELSAMCKAMDSDCSGAISYQELEKGVLRKVGPHDSAEEIWKVFHVLDVDATGRFTCSDMFRCASMYGAYFSDIECTTAFAAIAEGAPFVSYDAWKCVLSEMRGTTERI